jgi:hypothetical protein
MFRISKLGIMVNIVTITIIMIIIKIKIYYRNSHRIPNYLASKKI